MRSLLALVLVLLSSLPIGGQEVITARRRASGGGGGGTPVFVQGGAVGNLTVSGNLTTHTLGFTTGSGHFLVAESIGPANAINTATLQPSGTAMNCPIASQLAGSRNFITVCHLANAPSGQTSIVWGYGASNGATVTDMAAEYSGMSLTAAPVNTTFPCFGSFDTSAAWTCGPYTATANNLVWTTCASTATGPTIITANSPWNIRETWDAGTLTEMWFFDILGPAAGAYTGGGTFPPAPISGTFYDCETGSYV